MKYTNKINVIGNDIFAFEPYFNKEVKVAHIIHNMQTIYPAHGYFSPHPVGKLIRTYAKKIGYTFNNN